MRMAKLPLFACPKSDDLAIVTIDIFTKDDGQKCQ